MPSKATVFAIGRAPRWIVHKGCVRPDEHVYGSVERSAESVSKPRRCPRCRETVVVGVVVQGAAERHRK